MMSKPILWIVNNHKSLEIKKKRYSEEAIQKGFEVVFIDEDSVASLEVGKNTQAVLLFNQNKSSLEKIEFPDAILSICGTSFLAVMATELVTHASTFGIPVSNSPVAKALADNKWWTHQRLVLHSVPTPHTLYCGEKNSDSVLKSTQQLSYPLVLKTVYGDKGQGVLLCKTESEVIDHVATLAPEREIVIQEYLPATHGRDIRVIVVDGKIVGTMLRTAAPGGFHANLGAEGNGQAIVLTKAHQQLAIDATKALGLTLAGVDLLFKTDDELVVGEVNANPGLGIEEVVGCNVAGALIETLWQQVLKRRSKKSAK
jgi:RimK family alpha-L-glutamate ligase